MDDFYRDYILDHYRNPRNFGKLDRVDASAEDLNPLCGDQIRMELKLNNRGLVDDVKFSGKGCAISQASASMLTEQIRGKKVDEIEGLLLNFRKMMAGEEGPGEDELGDLVALKGVVKYPVRIKCAVLAWDALQEGISQYEKAH